MWPQARNEAVVQGNLDSFAKGQVRVQEEQRMKLEEPVSATRLACSRKQPNKPPSSSAGIVQIEAALTMHRPSAGAVGAARGSGG